MVEPPHNSMRLADRLAAVQRQHFVGRIAELELFRSAVAAAEPLFAVLHVYGPGGIGKTTLLHQYRRLAQEAGVLIVYLDGHSVDPSPPGFLHALSLTLDAAGYPGSVETLSPSEYLVLLIDTYENLTPLDTWLRETFLPQLPEMSLTVIAGRNSPDPAWRTTPGWRDLTRIVSLRNLHPEESRSYLQRRGVPHYQHAAALAFTHGHPLALALVADVVVQSAEQVDFDPQHAPDMVQVLLEHFVHHIPSLQHQQALEICAHVRVTTESLLTEFFDVETASRLFTWLSRLSFIEHNPEGIFPHDVVREVLDTNLRWRHPKRYVQVHRQARDYFVGRIRLTQGAQQQRLLFDWMFLHRHNRFAQTYHEWESFGYLYMEPAGVSDLPAILDMVQKHEGEISRQIAAHWLEWQPQAFFIFRSVSGDVAGFMARLALHQTTPEDLVVDPAARTAFEFAQPRSGEEVIHWRYWMGQDEYQSVALLNLVGTDVGAFILTHPNLAVNFVALADVDFWQPYFSYIYYSRCPEADFAVGGRHYGVVMHDWREQPPALWLDNLLQRELATDTKPEQLDNPSLITPFVLSHTEFEQAVRHALRDYTEPDLLAANPLARSRFAMSGSTDLPVITLQQLIWEAAERLRNNPKQEKLYRAVYHTYLQPAPTQEAAAELLDLPFSTYRYHLRHGVKRIADWLWQRELYGLEA